MRKVPATKPYFSEEDVEFITGRFAGILRGESFLSMGRYGEEFEARFAEYVGTRYAVSCSSGTSALELIFRALDIEGKEVIIPSNTFFATAIAVVNAGGTVVFADCDEKMCLDAEDAAARISPATAAICHVHIGGLVSGGALELRALCGERGIHFVEDACQAHGSSLGGERAGALGTAAGFSFFSTKVMTTGEGGMVTTDDPSLVAKMKSIREFGKVKKGIYTNYHDAWGYNWRMPEVAALLGLRQLASLDTFVRRRQEIASIYDQELGSLDSVEIVCPEAGSVHNYFKYILVLKNHERARIHEGLVEAGVSPSGYVYEIPLHKLPVFPESNSLSLPRTEFFCRQHVCLPIFVGLTDEQARFTAGALRKLLDGPASGRC